MRVSFDQNSNIKTPINKQIFFKTISEVFKMAICQVCHGEGTVAYPCSHENKTDDDLQCPDCGGDGFVEIECDNCNGTGEV